jgi:Putative zinc-finger
MQHPDEGTIHSWLDGALSADEAARVEAHVKECPECAATVAEARGFIAGASRILTALDNAPRGVIPAAAPKKRIDPWVLRVAATVLVVAAGTLLVVRNTGNKSVAGFSTSEQADTAPIPKPLPSVSVLADPSRSTTLGRSQTSAGSTKKGAAKVAASDTATVAQTLGAAAPRAPYSTEKRAPTAQTNILAQDNKAVAGQASGAVAERTSSASVNTDSAASTPQSPTIVRLRGANSLDYASQQPLLKVVATSRTIGATVTFYEVAPGDTVTLTELTSIYLESVVTTAVGTSSQPRQAAGKAPTVSGGRVDSVVAAPSPQSRTAGVALSAAPSAPTPAPPVAIANGVTTISWADTTTGKVLKLSGRMSETRLQQIKIWIERERAAAAAKKNP